MYELLNVLTFFYTFFMCVSIGMVIVEEAKVSTEIV